MFIILHKSWWHLIFWETLNVDFIVLSANVKPHFLKERIMESFIFPTLDHASRNHFVIRTFHWFAFILPSTYWSRFLSKWSSNSERTSSLNGLLINTSRTWARDVHPGGREVLFFFKSSFTLSVCCARWTSAIRIFPSEFWPIGFIKEFAYWVEIHSFIISWSHQAFSWYMTLTRRS